MAYSFMMIIAAVLVWQHMMLQSRGKLVFKPIGIGYSGSYAMYIIGCWIATIAANVYDEMLGTIAAAALVVSLIIRLLMPIIFGRIFAGTGEGIQFIAMLLFLNAARIGYILAAITAIVYAVKMMIN